MGSSASAPMKTEERDSNIKKIANDTNMPKDEIDALAKLFESLDRDESGYVSVEELEVAHAESEKYAHSFAQSEASDAGDVTTLRYWYSTKLNFEQFVTHRALVKKAELLKVPLLETKSIYEAYCGLDKDSDGRVSLGEFNTNFGSLGMCAQGDLIQGNLNQQGQLRACALAPPGNHLT